MTTHKITPKAASSDAPERPYYLAYEDRYRKVYEAGAERWGHSPEDGTLCAALADWVKQNGLSGKRVIEYACGEGAAGVILSKLGCVYRGVDVSPCAAERAARALAGYPLATVSQLDMVNERAEGKYDAALDVMGLHMLVTDDDRAKYLANVCASLRPGAPVLFFRESYRRDAYSGPVSSIEEWKTISCCDYETPEPRQVVSGGMKITVNLPILPARAKNEADYRQEMRDAGFEVDAFVEMDINEQCPYSAIIYAHKR